MLDMIKAALEEAIEITCSDAAHQEQVKEQVGEQVTEQIIQKILDHCSVPRTRKELQELSGISGRKAFAAKYLNPLLDSGKLVMTIPDKPTSRNQKYVRSEK